MDKKIENNDILTEVFRKRLENYEKPVSDDLWMKIAADIPAEKTSQKKYLWFKIAGVAAVALLGILIYGLYPEEDSPATRQAITAGISVTPKSAIQPSAKENEEKPSSTPTGFYASPGKGHIAKAQPAHTDNKKQENISPAPVPENIVPPNTPDPEKQNLAQDNQKEKPAVQDKQQTSRPVVIPPSQQQLWAGIRKKDKQTLSLALAYGNQGIPSSDPVGIKEIPNTFAINALRADAAVSSSVTTSEYKYKMPISVSFSVRKHLTPAWALESGLTYTYLESTETLTYPDSRSSFSNFELNYIGIPVKGVYSFIRNNRLSVYASTGGMVEKCIYGKKSFSSGQESEKLDIPELQLSVFGSVGLNYRLVDHLGLFVEPGVNYYFDDNSDVMTVRKDNPWNFGLQLGLRLSY